MKEAKIEYFKKFRLECHFRLDMISADFEEFPFYIYDGAHKQASSDTIKEFSEIEIEELDGIYSLFKEKIVEYDNYGKADIAVCEMIENSEV